MTEYEYACQYRDELDGDEWRIVEFDPSPNIELAREAFKAWESGKPGEECRIVRRPIVQWEVTDQSYQDTWRRHVQTVTKGR